VAAKEIMLADAGTLARSTVETTVYLGGLAVLEGFSKRMAASNNHHFFKLGEAIAEHLEEVGGHTAAAEAADLRQLLQEAQDKGHASQDINLYQLTKEVGMDPLYQVVYRQLSGDSAHPSVTSSGRHIVRGDGGHVEKLIFQPQRDGMEHTLSAAIAAFLGAMVAVSMVFSRSDIAATVDTYNALHHALGERIKH
jgi:hypothetical protein